MNHPKLKNCYDPLKILEAAYSLLYCCSGAKIIMFNAFSWAKNTARGVHFLLGFNIYLILAQCEQVYLFLALAHFNTRVLTFFCGCTIMCQDQCLHFSNPSSQKWWR